MKFYESHFEEYIVSVQKYNIHPELTQIVYKLPFQIALFENIIVYGPPGVGKYSQVLNILKKYSPSELKYDKKITAITDKQEYIYRISDIHYEVDMSLLGCNSKILWHEIFFQIVDIISVKSDKIGIILCKNFHFIHTELLEIFYSYMQHYNHSNSSIKIKFVLMMEHISYLPNTILNACQLIRVKRPTADKYINIVVNSDSVPMVKVTQPLVKATQPLVKATQPLVKATQPLVKVTQPLVKVTQPLVKATQPLVKDQINSLITNIEQEGILNIKELKSFPTLINAKNIPVDIFNIICDNIIKEMINIKTLEFTHFRDSIYDILTYNLDVTECLWYILKHFIENNYVSNSADISDILNKTYSFLKYYNNNYRPIYHLESILFYIINKVHKFDEL
jgi:hypothetical protein